MYASEPAFIVTLELEIVNWDESFINRMRFIVSHFNSLIIIF
jgi:hypothetical protein